MISALLLPLVLAGSPADSALLSAQASARSDDPPIQLWLNNDRRFLPGDRAKVQVRTEEDGYLLVLHADPDGYLRVLFPLDPEDDNFVRGGKKYEIRGRGGRESFDVEVSTGRGTVYAAVSRSPFRLDGYVLGDHWNYRNLSPNRLPREPETELTELVRRMAQGSFDYDLLTYDVIERVVYASDYSYSRPFYRSYAYYDDPCWGYYGCGSSISVGFFFGRPYRPYYSPIYYGYNPYYDPFFYDPFYYRPYYYRPIYYYPRQYYYHPYNYGYSPYGYGFYDRGRYSRPYTPYRFRGSDGATFGGRERRYTFGRAVNTVYTPPRSRFVESPRSNPISQAGRRAVEPGFTDSRHEVGSEPVLKRRQPGGERREATAQRRDLETGRPLIEARRARPVERERSTVSGSPQRRDLPVEIRPESRRADRPQVERAPIRDQGDRPEARPSRPSDDRRAPEPYRAPRAERGGDRGDQGGGGRVERSNPPSSRSHDGGGNGGGGGRTSSEGGARRR